VRDCDICVQFVEDTAIINFGDAHEFYGEDGRGADRYIERLRKKQSEDPECIVHVWLNNQIVGQVNLGRFTEPSLGYLNLLYVVPEWRGRGVATAIEAYASKWFHQRGFGSARLSVSISNLRALRFYLKHEWRDIGAREDRPAVHNMEKLLGV